MHKIFISYRRKGSEAITGRIRDRLVAHYGADSIFVDIDNIPAGADFRQRIAEVLDQTDIMIAVIGPKWLGSVKNRTGITRDNDWVRLEVESALRRKVLVIPVLVDGAQMPDARELPDNMKDFVYRNAIVVASGQDFDVHVARLIRSIDGMVATKASTVAQTVNPTPPSIPGPRADADQNPIKADRPTSATASIPVLKSEVPAQPTPEPVTASKLFDSPQPLVDRSAGLPPSQPVARPRWQYLAAAAIAGVLLFTGYYVYFPALPVVDAKNDPGPIVVAAAPPPANTAQPPSGKSPVQPEVAPPAKSATPATTTPDVPPPSSKIPPPEVYSTIAAAPPQPEVKPTLPPAVPPPAKSSCLAGAAQAVGGPLNPVSIRPNLTDAKEVRSVAVSPTGKGIATASDDGIIRIWDPTSFKLIRTLKGHSGAIYSLSYWSDGTLLASAGLDGTVRIWKTSDGSPVQIFDTRLFANNGGVAVKQFSVAFDPETPLKYMVSGGEDGIIRIWNVQNATQEKTRDQNIERDKATIRSLSFAPNGSGDYVTATYDGKIRVYLTSSRQAVTLDANFRKVLRAVYSPDNNHIVTAGSDGDLPNENLSALKIWNVKTQSSQTLMGHRDYVVSANWSRDGRRLVSGGGGADKSVVLWDADSGQKLAAFTGHHGDVEAVAFFAGGSRIVSAGEDKAIKVWNVADGKEILTAVGFGEQDYVLYTPAGCYSGSSGIESRLSATFENRPAPLNREALFVAEGFSSLLK